MSSTSQPHIEQQLETSRLSRRSLVSLSLASFIPAVGMGMLPVLMLSLAGPTAWLSATVAAVLVICIGRSVITFARRYVGTGSLYSYIQEVFGSWARYLTAAALMVSFVAQVGGVAATVGIFGGSFLEGRGVNDALGPVVQTVLLVAAIVVAGVVAYRGVDTSVRVAVTLAAVSVPLMAVITVASALHTGLDLGQQFDAQQFSIGGALKGVAAGAAWLVGFESCAAMAAETKNPTRNVPMAVMSVPVVLGTTYVVTTILQVPGLLAAEGRLSAGTSAPAALAEQAGLGSAVGAATDLVLAVASFAALIGFTNYGSRIAMAISEDGLLPAWVGAVHPRFHSPHRAVVALLILGFATIFALLLSTGDIVKAYSMIAPLVVYGCVAPYVLVSVGSVLVSRRVRELSPTVVVAATIGGAGMIWVYLNGWINPPAPPTDVTVWVAIVVLAVMTAFIGLRHRRSAA
ncbi:APC family permease [Rhodococcus wratislaviensis]|uniref:APC family permease n=1 Tax=Rhodococcus wratislaviensis TaxID=44752 RepID=UPI0035152EDD